MIDVKAFIDRSLRAWPEVAARFAALSQVETRALTLPASGTVWHVQYNPARAISTKADLTAKTLKTRRCFLCRENRPANQLYIEWEDMEILLNPYPIFPGHLTVCSRAHAPQSMSGRIGQMRRLSRELPGYTVFFNGARCGATAPDHMHFQAVPSQYLKLQKPTFTYPLCDDLGAEEAEELINVYCTDGEVTVMPRRKHRPDCYPDPAISPGAVDMAGTLIAVDPGDFERLTPETAERIICETSYQSPTAYVAIEGDGASCSRNDDGTWHVKGARIGKDFHWQQELALDFGGEMLRHNGRFINRVEIEEYLAAVISSEMNAKAFPELLKAHAVISRSWAVSQLRWARPLSPRGKAVGEPGADDDICTWQDRDDHTAFDLCNDDHCQRYQGLTRQTSEAAAEAVRATASMVLADADGKIIDARFSKCCGGIFEEFATCWQPRRYACFRPLTDSMPQALANMSSEENARRWIESAPDALCNCTDPKILGRALNPFDLQVPFFRWQETYAPEELDAMVKSRSGIDFGHITALIPLQRGPSGRIFRLKICGTNHTAVIGKELTIRRWLSTSHLRSSAFTVDRDQQGNWLLRGAGWGHGVGLCQIGAAVMASQGAGFRQILAHYYPGSQIISL